MQTGLMWFDDDPRKTLETKIEQAVARYREKYGRVPNACYVHPSVAPATSKLGSVHVTASRSIRPHYLWVGVEEKE